MFSLQIMSLLCFFAFMVTILIISFKWISSHFKTMNKNLPPSPRKLPIIGNLHQLGSSPHRSLHALSQKHGPLMLIHFGSVPVLVATSAEAAKEIMKTHDLNFASRPKLNIPDIVVYGSNDIVFSRYGDHWRQAKSIAVVHLLSATRVRSFQQVRENEMAFMIKTIEKDSGSITDLSEVIFCLMNNTISKVALGRTYRSKFRNLLERFLEVLGAISVGSYIPWLSWIDRLSGLEGKALKIAKEFDDFLKGVVEEHSNKRKEMDDAQSDDEGQDLVDILLDVQRDNATGFTVNRETIKAIILDVFVAGTDAPYVTLIWAISELLRHPRVMKKLQQEAIEIAQGKPLILEKDLEKMEYLKAIIKESLRMHPPVPLLIPRESREDVKLMGYDIPKGTQTLVNAWAIGRDPTLWKEPYKFWPERFLNSSTDYKGVHFELIPFGAGRRGCPGIQFGVAIIELALANMVYKFDLALPNGVKGEDLDMSETLDIALHRTSSLMVIASPRFTR